MRENRVFVPQDALDQWLSEGRVEIHDNTMKLLPDGQRFNLKTAVRFTSEVAGGGDALKLVGKVKDMDQVTELSGEYSQGSVVLGDNAYEVVDGFVGEAIVDSKFVPAPSEKDSHSNEDVDLLAKFFMQSKRK
ncbi:MAG: hypothetical protein IPK60_16065 [Sandaracinaceae bacterium]|nr:hypothetical protein [Sandaracinaceae bacterium]